MKEYAPGGWNLKDLVEGPGDLERRLAGIQRRVKKFQKVRGILAPGMRPAEFRGVLREIECISEGISVVGGFASLGYSADTQSDAATALMTRISKFAAEMENRMLFFETWWKKGMGEAEAGRLISESGDLGGHLDHMRRLGKYFLSEPEERIINTLDVTGAGALVKIYDKITGAFEYKVKGRGKMSREELTSLVRSPGAATRRDAYNSLLGKFSGNSGVLGEIYRNIVTNWSDEGIGMRGHDSPISIRNIANDVDDSTVESLLGVCRENAGVFQKFFRLKARMLGVKRLRRYDLYAPASAAPGKKFTYGQSVRLVLDSLGRFSPELAGYARKVFEHGHVDSAIRPGKMDGAFCSTPAPGITPYVMVNFAGRSKDVFTLAHEVGHAVHGMAASGRSVLVQNASLPLAETASTFSELLLYDSLSDMADDGQKKAMLAEQMDDLYATIMRQAYFTIFEAEAHREILCSATIDGISEAYLACQREQFGRSVEVTDDFGIEWSCIPHFYHAPFYCYAYSFGNLLALSLFQRFRREGAGFARTYARILGSGGSKRPEKLLSEHGMDITSRAFWQEGFDYTRDRVDELAKITHAD